MSSHIYTNSTKLNPWNLCKGYIRSVPKIWEDIPLPEYLCQITRETLLAGRLNWFPHSWHQTSSTIQVIDIIAIQLIDNITLKVIDTIALPYTSLITSPYKSLISIPYKHWRRCKTFVYTIQLQVIKIIVTQISCGSLRHSCRFFGRVVDVGYSDLPHDPSHAFQPDTLDHPKHHHEKPYSHKNHLGWLSRVFVAQCVWFSTMNRKLRSNPESITIIVNITKYHHKHHKNSS